MRSCSSSSMILLLLFGIAVTSPVSLQSVRSAAAAAASAAAESYAIDFDLIDPNTLLTQQSWKQRASVPIELLVTNNVNDAAGDDAAGFGGVHHPITFANATHGFVLTGTTNEESYTSLFYTYEADTDTWTDLSSSSSSYAFPGSSRSYGYGVSPMSNCGENTTKAYVGFGAGMDGTTLTDFWEFDMSTGVWQRLAEFPGPGRKHPAMNYIESLGEIHVGLGDGIGGNYNDWWSYSIPQDAWTQLPDFPATPRHHPFYFAIGTDSYVGFGHSRGAIERDWYKWDTLIGQWSAKDDFASYPVGTGGGGGGSSSSSSSVPVTTEARVAGTQFSVSSSSCSTTTATSSSNSNSNNDDGTTTTTAAVGRSSSSSLDTTPTTVTTLGFVLSGDGDDHRTMATGEFHVYDPTGGGSGEEEEGGGRYWRSLPSHPGYSRWAPGTFVLQGTQRVFMVGGYDRRTRILHGDMWTIDLEPLFSSSEQQQQQQQQQTTTTITENDNNLPSWNTDNNSNSNDGGSYSYSYSSSSRSSVLSSCSESIFMLLAITTWLSFIMS